jgi:tetratricopeptide (TPR) repeat protein
MKHRLALTVGVVALIAGLLTPATFAQMSGSVTGVCKDENGNPVVNATVEYDNTANGRKYTGIKTNKKGEYYSLGIEPGTYNVLITSADGKPIDKVSNFRVVLGENTLNSDLKARSTGTTLPPAQVQKMQEEHTKTLKENDVIKLLNQKLATAKQASSTGDFDTAIAQMTEATQLDPNRDLLWFTLANAYKSSSDKQTDAAEKSKRLDASITDYQKAVDLREQAEKTDPKSAQPQNLAAYYNNLGAADAAARNSDGATKAYERAAQVNPASAAQYYYNLGAVLTNAGKVDDANAAFDKCIAADPTKAEAYYQKGLNLLNKATLKDGKMIAPPGTAEAFNKYLELKPTGEYADPAKQMLASIGATVETGYGNNKKKK